MTRKTPLANVTRELLEPLWLQTTLTTDEIGARLGVTGSAIRWRARQMGLPRRGGIAKRRGLDAEFERMWRAGVHSEDIARHFGYSHRSAVSTRAMKMGLPQRRRVEGAGKNNGAGLCGWGGTIRMRDFREMEIGRRMAEAAR